MFYIVMIIGVLMMGGGGFYILWTINKSSLAYFHRLLSVLIVFIGGLIIISSFYGTAQGELFRKQILSGAKKGNWIITDDSGGRVMRHWLLEDGYVQGCSQTDGWKFYDTDGNLHYVSGDSHVAQLKKDPYYIEEFKKTFKKNYNIPEDQPTLK